MDINTGLKERSRVAQHYLQMDVHMLNANLPDWLSYFLPAVLSFDTNDRLNVTGAPRVMQSFRS
jgi:hypothetical protein